MIIRNRLENDELTKMITNNNYDFYIIKIIGPKNSTQLSFSKSYGLLKYISETPGSIAGSKMQKQIHPPTLSDKKVAKHHAEIQDQNLVSCILSHHINYHMINIT